MRESLLHTIVPLILLVGASRALLILARSGDISGSNETINDGAVGLDDILATQTVSGNTECAAASSSTSFLLSFISYGNYTILPGEGEDDLAPKQLVSMSFAISNAANGIYTICAFPLGHLSVPSANSGDPATWIDDASWQACADRKDSDGKHRFTVATGAAFDLSDRRISVNQTWFCHDEDARLVAYTGITSETLTMSCVDGGELGGYHVENCTSSDVVLPVTLL
ncbi:hypothetical protein M426DRAFT_18709 [Hypoxylon sp. CI-4A]|nr:hypothetical protein M426DRAFT_18709 [Hypoxylon sp. CI-4A]